MLFPKIVFSAICFTATESVVAPLSTEYQAYFNGMETIGDVGILHVPVCALIRDRNRWVFTRSWRNLFIEYAVIMPRIEWTC